MISVSVCFSLTFTERSNLCVQAPACSPVALKQVTSCNKHKFTNGYNSLCLSPFFSPLLHHKCLDVTRVPSVGYNG